MSLEVQFFPALERHFKNQKKWKNYTKGKAVSFPQADLYGIVAAQTSTLNQRVEVKND